MKKLIFGLIIFLLSLSTETQAQFYIGGGIGNSFINKTLTNVDGSDLKIDENDFGYKIFAGFGKKFIGAEGGYRDLGKVKTSYNDLSLQTKISGWDVAARGKIDIGPLFAFGKAGAFFAKSKNQIGTTISTDNSTNFLWALGAGIKLGPVALRLEYESLNIGSGNNLSQLMFGAAFYLGGSE